MAVLLRLEKIVRTFEHPSGGDEVTVLSEIDLDVEAGRSLAVTGPSGSGKSTLLNIMGGLDRPTSGAVSFAGRDLAGLEEEDLAGIRNREIGFVFQLHYLLPQCTVLENVLIPTLPLGPKAGAGEARDRAERLLDRVGLGAHLDHFPAQISGGERQRTAVIRALINRPRLILADEPTGSLDRESAGELGELLVELNREEGTTLIVVTHNLDLARRMEVRFILRGGRLEEIDRS